MGNLPQLMREPLRNPTVFAANPQVIEAIDLGLSLRKAAAHAGVSVNTVRKVQKALIERG